MARWRTRAIGWPLRSAIAALALSVLTFADHSAAGADDVPIDEPAPVAAPRAVEPPPVVQRLDIETTFAAWMDAAAAVTVRVEAGESRGSGTLVSPRHVLTAAHVVGEAQEASIRLPDGRTVAGRVVQVDASRDLALIDLTEAATRCAPVAEGVTTVGAWVVTTGILGGVEHESAATSSVGVVLSLAAGSNELFLHQGIAHGMSGGPVLTPAGEVVGIISRLSAATSVTAADPLLAGVSCEVAPTAHAIQDVPFDDASWNTARDTALAAQVQARAAPSFAASVIELARWSVSTRGIVVAPELVLTSVDPNVAREGACEGVHVTGSEALACTEATVRGELMLLRFPGLAVGPLTAADGAEPERGGLLSTADGRAWGVVDAAALSPGELVPYVPPLEPGGCGTLANMRYEQSPRVVLGSVLAHDVGAIRGDLLLDARGRPSAIHVASHLSWRGYAVPLREALARFGLALPSE